MEKHSEKYYENKEKILDCFLTLLDHEGYNHATISQVSKITGLSYGSITNIFNTKEDILLEVLKANSEKYLVNIKKSEDPIFYFLKNIIIQFKKIEHDDNLKLLLLEQFSLPKTTAYLKEHIAHMLQDSLEDKHDCYFKAIAIVGIVREYINTEINSLIYSDKKINNLIEDILLICKYSDEMIEQMKLKLY